MIRWSYVFPRLLILALAILFFVFSLDPLLRWTAIHVGQRVTGAKVEIGHLQSSLLRSAVHLGNVQLADPGDTDRNLVEAKDIILRLDNSELLRRRWVVDQGYVLGLRFDASRTTSGALDPDEVDQDQGGGIDFLSGVGEGLLDYAVDRAEEEFESLESVKLSREMMVRWPAEYDRLDARTDQWKTQIDDLRSLAEEVRDNPWRALETSHQTLQHIDSLRRAPAELRSQINRLSRQAKVDREAMDAARKRDMQRIREKIDVVDIDTERLTEYLVDEEWSDRIRTLVGYVKQFRELLAAGGETTRPGGQRGQDILFPGLPPRPDFLIRSLVIEGEANVARQRIPLAGTATDITSHPKIHGKPAIVRLQSKAAGELEVYAIVDQTGEQAHSRIIIDCPHLPQPATTLGRPDDLALGVSPGHAHLWTQVELAGEASLSGRILYKRDKVALAPQIGQKLTNSLITNAWTTAAGAVHEVQASVDLSGTVTSPKWKLKTNLGPQLASGLNAALTQELADRQEQLAGRLKNVTDQQMSRLIALVSERQKKVLGELHLGEQEIESLRQLLAKKAKAGVFGATGGLPLDKLLPR